MQRKFSGRVVSSAMVLILALLGWTVTGPAGATQQPLTIYLSSTTGGTVGGVTFADEDITAYDPVSDTWSVTFDGSDVGLGSADIDGFAIISLEPLVIEMTFTAGRSVPGVGIVDDSDVVRFSGTGGPDTSGGFLLVLDSSDLGFSTNNEDLDALGRSGSDFVFSTLGSFSVPALAGDDEDLISFSPTSIGPQTAGVVTQFRDGTADGLGPSDVTGVSVDPVNGRTYGAASLNYTVGGVVGDGDDVFMFPGLNMPAMIAFDGDQHGYGGEQIDGIHVGPGTGDGERASADLMVAIDDNTASVPVGGTIAYTVTVTNNGPDDAVNVLVAGTPSAGLTITGATGCSAPQATLPCLVDLIESGQNAVVTVDAAVSATASGSVDLGIAVSSAADDPVPGNNTGSSVTPVVSAPAAVDDSPDDGSIPGDRLHVPIEGSLAIVDGPDDLLTNDELGTPPGAIVSFGGGDLGGSVADNAAGTTITVGDGSLNIGPDGAVSFTAPSDLTGQFTVNYRLANPVGDSDATATIFVGPRPTTTVYLSSTSSGVVGGIAFDDEDIVSHDSGTGLWEILFDGSDVGLGGADVDGFHIVGFDPLTINLSLTGPRSVAGLGIVDDSDVFTFTGLGGPNTSGSFSMLIDSSDLGISSGGEDVDAVGMSGSDHLLSTIGSFNIPGGLTGRDEDLLSFTPTSTGPVTTGALSLAFDGSDVGMATEDLTGVWFDPVSGEINGAALGSYTIAGTPADGDDVFAFTGTTGPNTVGTARIVFDGDQVGFGGEQIDGVHLVVNSGQ